MQLALVELYQLDMRPLELTAAMQLLLGGPDTLPSAWIAKDSPFEAALAGDKSTDTVMLELSGTLGRSP
jgi:hypothetical protein